MRSRRYVKGSKVRTINTMWWLYGWRPNNRWWFCKGIHDFLAMKDPKIPAKLDNAEDYKAGWTMGKLFYKKNWKMYILVFTYMYENHRHYSNGELIRSMYDKFYKYFPNKIDDDHNKITKTLHRMKKNGILLAENGKYFLYHEEEAPQKKKK